MLEFMERTVEAVTRLEASPEPVIEVLTADPAGVLGGTRVPGGETFVAPVAVELGGGASLAVDVDMTFGRLPDEGGVGRFGLSWQASEHEGAFPAFGGDLEVHPDGEGTLLRLTGYYRPPLGAVGAFGDGLVGHRLARRALQDFVEAVTTQLQAALAARLVAAAPITDRASRSARREQAVAGSELYLG
jgi:hypothetical protein